MNDPTRPDRNAPFYRPWWRRRFLQAAAAAGVTGLAGCNFGRSEEAGTPAATDTPKTGR